MVNFDGSASSFEFLHLISTASSAFQVTSGARALQPQSSRLENRKETA
jgi:hypothetical protein